MSESEDPPPAKPPSFDPYRTPDAQQHPYQPYPQYQQLPQYPQYGANPWPTEPQRKPGTNGFAIAALIFGLIGGIPLAIVFGVIALGQTANGRQPGRGLAIAGLIGAGAWLAGIVAVGVYAAVTAPERDDSGQITESGSVSTFELETGDCLDGVRDLEDDTEITTLPAVPCDQPHEGEVYATFELENGDYPGIDGIVIVADERCSQELMTYSPPAWDDPNIGVLYIYPYEEWWPREREVVCIAIAMEGTLTGSLTAHPGV